MTRTPNGKRFTAGINNFATAIMLELMDFSVKMRFNYERNELNS